MLQWFKKQSYRSATARQLYGACVAAARDPMFYQDWRVADTFDGRFEVVMLHVALLLRRLSANGTEGKGLGQALVEQMFAALDDDMRAVGVGDLTVPKKVHAAASAFYGRLRIYDAALGAMSDDGLCAALARNMPAANSSAVDSGELARYTRSAADALHSQTGDALNRGVVVFDSPREPARRQPA
jgi:cytochrome b pre-mRNA-processing protein 3